VSGHRREYARAAYQASLKAGEPLSERKLAAMFGKTSRRWARDRMAEARGTPYGVRLSTASIQACGQQLSG